MTGIFRKKAEASVVRRLTGPQVTALMGLAAGRRKKDAAKLAGVHPQAVSEWLGQPHFRVALDSFRAELIKQASETMRALTTDSLVVLRDTLKDEQPALRLKASMYVLDRLLAVPVSAGDDVEPELDATKSAAEVMRSLGVSV